MIRKISFAAALMVLIGPQTHAGLLLDTDVTSTFAGGATSSIPVANDLPGYSGALLFGQLKATSDGFLDIYYLGNEAGYVNSLLMGGLLSHSTAGLPDTFTGPYDSVGSLAVAAGAFADFGFCTSGGTAAGAYGRCVSNADTGSLTAQFNHEGAAGYRSIGYRPLTSFDPLTGLFTYSNVGGASDLWMMFWDDSGASNDDDHDDYIAVGRFRPVTVPEPASVVLLGAGLLGLAATRLRRRTAASPARSI